MKTKTVPSGLKSQNAILYLAAMSEISLEQKLVYERNLVGSLAASAEFTGNTKYLSELKAAMKIIDNEVQNMDIAGDEALSYELFRKLNRIMDFLTKIIYDPEGYADFSGSDRFTLLKSQPSKEV